MKGRDPDPAERIDPDPGNEEGPGPSPDPENVEDHGLDQEDGKDPDLRGETDPGQEDGIVQDPEKETGTETASIGDATLGKAQRHRVRLNLKNISTLSCNRDK